MQHDSLRVAVAGEDDGASTQLAAEETPRHGANFSEARGYASRDCDAFKVAETQARLPNLDNADEILQVFKMHGNHLEHVQVGAEHHAAALGGAGSGHYFSRKSRSKS